MKLNQTPKHRGADRDGLPQFVSALLRAFGVAGSSGGLAVRAALIAACLVAVVLTMPLASGDDVRPEAEAAAPQAELSTTRGCGGLRRQARSPDGDLTSRTRATLSLRHGSLTRALTVIRSGTS